MEDLLIDAAIVGLFLAPALWYIRGSTGWCSLMDPVAAAPPVVAAHLLSRHVGEPIGSP